MSLIAISGHAPYTEIIRNSDSSDFRLHNPNIEQCQRCRHSARPNCPACGHSLSAGTNDFYNIDGKLDGEYGYIVCEVCHSVIKVKRDEMI